MNVGAQSMLVCALCSVCFDRPCLNNLHQIRKQLCGELSDFNTTLCGKMYTDTTNVIYKKSNK